MNIQMNTASNSMRELQKKVDIIANNISNVNTHGFKRHEANFSDTLVQSITKQAGAENEIGRLTPNGLRIGSGVKIGQSTLRNEQGALQQTGRELDFNIQGSGFFRVANGDNVFYTKDGSLHTQPVLNSNRLNLVTANGDAVLDINNNPISFDANYSSIKVSPNGTMVISYKTPGKQADAIQLSIADIARTNLLEKVGGNRYQLPGTEGEQIANGTMRIVDLSAENNGAIRVGQNALEMSNVDMTEEMTELIATQRLIQSQGKAISFADDMMGLVNTIRG